MGNRYIILEVDELVFIIVIILSIMLYMHKLRKKNCGFFPAEFSMNAKYSSSCIASLYSCSV